MHDVCDVRNARDPIRFRGERRLLTYLVIFIGYCCTMQQLVSLGPAAVTRLSLVDHAITPASNAVLTYALRSEQLDGASGSVNGKSQLRPDRAVPCRSSAELPTEPPLKLGKHVLVGEQIEVCDAPDVVAVVDGE